MIDIKGAFERERANYLNARKSALSLKQETFGRALANASEILAKLKAEGIYSTEAQPSPVADWLEQFYEHGCVWFDEEMQKVTKHWMQGRRPTLQP